MFGASVPEAPVDENGDPCRSKDDVCAPAEVSKRLSIDTVAETSPVKQPPHGQLRLRIPGTVCLHDAPTTGGCGPRSGSVS